MSKRINQGVFHRTYSPKERARFREILANPKARHRERCFLVGRLCAHGYLFSEISWIIHSSKLCQWSNYDYDTSEHQIRWIWNDYQSKHAQRTKDGDAQ